MQKLILITPGFTIEITGDNEREIIKQAAFWSSIPTECPQCGKGLRFDYRTPQTFEYYEVVCTGPDAHRVQFGEAKVTHDLYFDRSKPWKRITGNGVEFETTPAATPKPASGSATSDPASTGKQKNHLIKLIGTAKDAGIRTGLMAADVAKMDVQELENQATRIAALLDKAERAGA